MDIRESSLPASAKSGGVLRVGLTGGIASGKSLVGKMLRDEFGVPIVDADDLAHDILDNDPDVKARVLDTFGPSVMTSDQRPDRKKLGPIVFANPTLRKALESWIHPKVRERIAAFFEANSDRKLAVALVPLIFESKIEHHFDTVWLVKATPEQQIERMTATRPLTRDAALARLNSQMPLSEKIPRANWVIDNTGTVENTRQQLETHLKSRGLWTNI